PAAPFPVAAGFPGNGTAGQTQGEAVTADAAGNLYVTGRFVGAVDLAPGSAVGVLTSLGGQDAFVAKYSSTGTLLWARSFGSAAGDDVGYDVKVDASGTVYATGTFFGTADFDPGAGVTNLTAVG